MDLRLGGKTAYVTGGAHGIGAGIVKELVIEGVRVVTSDVDKEALHAGVQELRGLGPGVTPVVADLSSAAGIRDANQAVLETLGGAPDFLVNNVGVAASLPFTEITDEHWQKTFDLNFMSYVRTARELVPLMSERPGSAVVNIASDLAKQPEIIPVDYGAMKAAVLHFSKTLSLEFAPSVRTNAILPGPVWTGLWTKPGGLVDMFMDLYKTNDRDQAVREYLKDRQLTFGISQPEDVAALVTFVLSPRAKQINGAALDIGGTLRSLF